METKLENPLLKRARLPGEVHRLPSRGLFYKNGELDASVKDAEVEIYPMTALDEITMKSPDLLLSGEAAKKVITRCVPAVLQPEKLLKQDMDFLMTVLRKVTYGDELELSYTHTCKNAQTHTYVTNLSTFIQRVRSIDPTTVENKFQVVLPNGQVVKVIPLRYEFVINMMQLTATNRNLTTEAREELVIDTLLNIIESVDEITDKALIREWLQSIQVGWTKQIQDAIENAQSNWGPEFTIKLTCKDCGEEVDVETPMNPLTFFI
jgi:hypothetical protein